MFTQKDFSCRPVGERPPPHKFPHRLSKKVIKNFWERKKKNKTPFGCENTPFKLVIKQVLCKKNIYIITFTQQLIYCRQCALKRLIRALKRNNRFHFSQTLTSKAKINVRNVKTANSTKDKSIRGHFESQMPAGVVKWNKSTNKEWGKFHFFVF